MIPSEKEFDVQLNDDEEIEIELPLLPVRDTVVFPQMLTPLFVGRERSVLALEAALAENNQLVVVTQRDAEQEDPTLNDLYNIGTEVIVGRMLKMPDGSNNILVQGHRRVEILGEVEDSDYPNVRVLRLEVDD